jgi:bifunctional non-homologous end joining protein LigD
VANMSKARRKGRMFIDYLRNGQGSTAICPWSTRARPGGPVAVPVTWAELTGLDRANAFDIFTAAARAQGADAWEGYAEANQVLTPHAQQAVRP